MSQRLNHRSARILLAGLEEEDLPNNTYYGDGSPIEPSVLEEIREAYRMETVSFAWQEGDILMLDNMLRAWSQSLCRPAKNSGGYGRAFGSDSGAVC